MRDNNARIALKKVVVATSLFSGMYVVGSVVLLHGYEAVGDGIGMINQTVAALWFASFIYAVVIPNKEILFGWLRWIGARKTLQKIGKYSYAMYVFHLPLLFLGARFTQREGELLQLHSTFQLLLTVVLVVVCSFGLSMLSWYVLEQPCQRLKGRFYTKAFNEPLLNAAK